LTMSANHADTMLSDACITESPNLYDA